MAVRKPHKDALAALSGTTKDQVEFLLTYNPHALLGTISESSQNVYISKRKLREAIGTTLAEIMARREGKSEKG